MVEATSILIGVAMAVVVFLLLALVAYAAWERRNSAYQYSKGVLDTLQDPQVVHSQHVGTAQDLGISMEEHTNSKNSLINDREELDADGSSN